VSDLIERAEVLDGAPPFVGTREQLLNGAAYCVGKRSNLTYADKAIMAALARALIDTTAERDALRERVARLEAVSADLAHALRWCGGSSDFNEGGKAEAGWKRVVIPALDARAALQEDTPNE
jgi:hypothetical protein